MVSYFIGSTLSIQLGLEDWLDPDGTDLKVKIELTRDDGSSWETITSSTDNFSTYNWTVTGPVGSNKYFKYSDPDDSSVYFYSSAFNIIDQQEAPSIKNLSALLDCIAFKIVIGSPTLSADFQNISIPFVGTANPSLSDVEITDYEYSTDGGITYKQMTLTNSIITGLTFGVFGTNHVITWSARLDLDVLLYNTPLAIRLIGYSSTHGLYTINSVKSFEITKNTTQQNITQTSTFPIEYKGTFGINLLKLIPKSINR
jgi:hypothetical protein